MPACEKCGGEYAEGARFCPACGAPLAETRMRAETRKTVTIVFSDLAGSTSMGERLDPESVRRVMSRYFAEMRSALERHGGTVEKFIGDAVMAVFGVPTLHEDDALRAVRATADMRNSLAALNDDLEQKWGVRLQVRTGVNTGKVVAGDPAQGQAFVVGDAVNVAARLEQSAGSGEVLIGEETYRLVRDAVTVEPTAPLTLKGKAEPLPAFKLLDVSASVDALDQQIDSPLIGRSGALTTLRQEFEHAVNGGILRLCTVVGPAGIGKSRLTDEFLLSLDELVSIFRGRCLPYGEGITYWPVAEVVRQAAGLDDDDSVREARAKIMQLVSKDEDGAQIVERVAAALGFSESASSPEETQWGVRRLLEALAAERPVVVVLDDIHWGEPTFLALIEHLAERGGGGAIVVLCLARSELLESRPDFASGADAATVVTLEPLDASENERLITNLVGEGDLAQVLARRVREHAGGNPLYVREVIRMLVDEGILERDNGRWHSAVGIEELRIPPTIEALLGARLDQLDARERALLEGASVIGEEFWTAAILALCPEIGLEAADVLESLLKKELIREQHSNLAEEAGYSFTHILVRDVAYDGLLKESRAELHSRFADWLQNRVGQRVSEYEEIIGYHLERSYGYRSEIGTIDESTRAVGTRAAEHLASAGRRAFTRGDLSAAANLLTRASLLLPQDDLFRLEIQRDLAEVLMGVGELHRADHLLVETIEGAAEKAEQGLEYHARIIRLLLQLAADPEGKTDEARGQLTRAIPILEKLGEERALAKAWRLKAVLHLMTLSSGEMEAAAERAFEYAERSGDESDRHEIYQYLALAIVISATPVPIAIARAEKLLEQAKDDAGARVYATHALCLLNSMRGNFDEARRLSAIATGICEELGWRYLLAAGVTQVDWQIELLAGKPAAAERAARSGYELLVAMGDKSSLSTLAAMLAEALYLQRRDEEANRFTSVSEEAAASDDVLSQVMWRGTRAKLLARGGQLADAESLAREAVALARRTDAPSLEADSLMNLAEVVRLTGEPGQVEPIVDEALSLYRAKGDLASAGRAQVLRESLSPARR